MVLVACALLVLAVIGGGYVIVTEYSKYRRTKAILTAVYTGLEMCIACRSGPRDVPLAFVYLQREFDTMPIGDDLRALQAIDQQRQSFVDAWGRPLVIRVSSPTGSFMSSFEVISAGPDGLHGTSDDLHN